MLSCNTDNAKEQAEEGERYEAVTAGCGKGGGGSHPFSPHPADKTQNNVFLQCSGIIFI